MTTVFLKLLNMSITAGWITLAVILLRLLLRRAPKALFTTLWALVGIRLILPFSIESALSLIPSSETIPVNMGKAILPLNPSGLVGLQSGISPLDQAVNPFIYSSDILNPSYDGSTLYTLNPALPANPVHTIILVLSVVWLIGAAVMLTYTAVSYLSLRRKVREAIALRDNIMLCDRISSPFILGVIHPKIYLPSTITEEDAEYVIAHETAHLKRRDHLWKPLGFLLLSVYWFNPLLWIAYILLCRDIEMACDERVIRSMGAEYKKPYLNTLVNLSSPRKTITACPLAFGEVGVKARIKKVLNYKKPALWVIVVSVVLCIAASVCLLTNPIKEKEKEKEITAHFDDENGIYELNIDGERVDLSEMNIEELYNYLDSFNDRDVANICIAALNEFSQTPPVTGISNLVFTGVLCERINNYSEEYLISLISGDDNTVPCRMRFCEMYDDLFLGKTPKGVNQLKDMLKDDSVHSALKATIIDSKIDFGWSEDDLDLLSELANSDNIVVVGTAKRILSEIEG